MSIYMSRAELEEISEGLITAYANKFSNRVIQSIDIEHFITEFLMLRIEYASFAEDDAGRIGFLADGATPLLVHQDGKIHQVGSGEIVGKTAVIREQKNDSANEIHHISQHQITHHRQQWRKTIIGQKPLYLINHLL